MMETKISNEVESNKYPVVSHPRPAPARNNSKIGRIKIRTPAEINKEFDDTHNSASMSVDSPDRLRALSFADFLRPPNPPPSVPSISTVSQLKEPSAKVVKPKRKSRYPGFGENTPSQLTEPSAKVVKPKRKSRYAGFGETIPSQLTKPSSKVEKPNPGFGGTIPSASRGNKAFQPESSSSRENQEKVDDSFSSVTRSYPTPSSVTRSFPTPSSVTRSFPTPSSVVRSYPTPSSVTRSFLTPSKAIISYSTPSSVATASLTPSSVTTSSLTPSLVTTSYPTPASTTTSVLNEAGSGIRRNYSGFGGTTILSPSQGNRLKEHRVSDNDARNISASWQTLKPSLKPTDFKIPNKNQVSSSASVSKSCAARSSSSQTAQDQVGESFSNKVKQVFLSHKLPQGTPKLLQHFRPNPGFEKDKLYNISKPTGFNLRRDNMASTPSSFATSANSTGSQVIRKTKYKGVTSSLEKIGFEFYRENSEITPDSVSQARSDPNKSGVEGSNIRKKYPGFGEITNSKDLQVIEKTKDRRLPSSDNKTATNSVREKLSSKSTYKIHELDEISKSHEEDWDSSLREWIPSEQCANVQKRKAYRGFGEVTNSRKKKKNKPKTDAGVRSNFDKTNKTNRPRELRRITLPEENSIGSPSSVANFSTETILEDLSSGFKEKMDENDNTNLQENYEVQNDDMSTDTDTEDGGRKKLLDGVVFTISGYEDPLRGQIVGKAVAMGARYRTGWTNDCSHLVCGVIDTFKYLQAKGRGKIVRGSWIEDCYKLRKKVDWKEHILSEEKADNEPTDENADNEPTEKTSSKNDGVRFLAGMAVRLKDSCLFEQFAGAAAFVRGMYHDRVHVVIQGYGQLSLAPAELEHLLPERGNKAKYVMKCLGENTVEVVDVDEGAGIAVVRYDGYKGAVVQLTHLCRVEEI